MKRKLFKKGEKLRLKVPLLSGYKGIGTVTEDQDSQDDNVCFERDDIPGSKCRARPYEVSCYRRLSTS